jgi:hypothetical protein
MYHRYRLSCRCIGALIAGLFGRAIGAKAAR